MLLAAMAVMVTLFATVAYAAEVLGTDQSDVLYESQRGDSIRGLDGNDTIGAARFSHDRTSCAAVPAGTPSTPATGIPGTLSTVVRALTFARATYLTPTSTANPSS
jgi:hypothetical protein